ncbi:Membrane-bound transcription factor site-2 protease-like protein [Thalictrum thalictroides]|uniref:Endopeptidase S2P n=1 Tax=Thalictrum thalictroides TaxID=46969 RepID=A0A7J6X3V6_THATH|nr:Membrane-bound transcription factor site-2 protease-like protein [Thalictrum thalictroides]
MALVGGRRARRSYGGGGGRSTSNTTTSVLPIRRPQHLPSFSHTISCWYCDLKISAFNDFLFCFGRKHARFLRIWFSIGTGFGITALLGVTLILLRELLATISSLLGNAYANSQFQTFDSSILFGFLPSRPSASGSTTNSLADSGYIVISTLISVAVHEFGHAISAASEGIQIEYIAIYIAVMFPGALVAFNYESLQTLPQRTTLRIYCAGIWHNAVILDVTSTSPLSSYLSPGDIIESVDGLKIHDPREWMEMLTLMSKQSLQNLQYGNDSESSQAITSIKGYCVPNDWMKDEEKIQLVDNYSFCPAGLTAFSTVPCFDTNVFDDVSSEDVRRNTTKGRQCFNAGDVVQLNKCGKGWLENRTNGSSCDCSQDEACIIPSMVPGLMWVKISYKRPYSSECLWLGKNLSVLGSPGATNCGGTFVFIGDVLSIENSVQLTAYQPRLALKFALNLPNFLEKLLACIFHVSLTLALLNSLPVFLLDGESILEATISCIPSLSSRKRALVLQICLLGGTLLSILAFSRVLFSLL